MYIKVYDAHGILFKVGADAFQNQSPQSKLFLLITERCCFCLSQTFTSDKQLQCMSHCGTVVMAINL